MQKDQTIITDKRPDAIIEKTAYIHRKARERGLGRGRETSADVPQLATSNSKQYHGSSSFSTDVMVTDTIHLVHLVIPMLRME